MPGQKPCVDLLGLWDLAAEFVGAGEVIGYCCYKSVGIDSGVARGFAKVDAGVEGGLEVCKGGLVVGSLLACR